MATADRQRPQAKARRRPQAAPDENLDPVVPGAAPAETPVSAIQSTPSTPDPPKEDRAQRPKGRAKVKTELPVAVPRRRRGEPTVQLNVRQPPEVAALVDAVVEATGASKAEVVEAALRSAYQVASD